MGVRSEEKGTVFGTEPYEDHQSQYSPDVSITCHSYCNIRLKIFSSFISENWQGCCVIVQKIKHVGIFLKFEIVNRGHIGISMVCLHMLVPFCDSVNEVHLWYKFMNLLQCKIISNLRTVIYTFPSPISNFRFIQYYSVSISLFVGWYVICLYEYVIEMHTLSLQDQ